MIRATSYMCVYLNVNNDMYVSLRFKIIFVICTLLRIIKGTHVRNVIYGLPYMLHFTHAV